MPSPETINFESLLAPIAGENPAGEAVRYSGVYDAIQEARRADEDLPMGEWQREVKTSDWAAVVSLASETLAGKSKDLQVAVWLVEALLKRHGFAGLRDGLRVLRALQENFWEALYPEIEEGDLEFRAGPLQWLNEKLPAHIREVPITEGDSPCSWNRWDESRAVDNMGRQNQEAMASAIAEGKITGEQFEQAVQATPRLFYENLLEDLAQSKEQLSQLEGIVDEKFGRSAPSLLAVRKAIDECHGLVNGLLKRKREQEPGYRPKTAGNSEPGEGEPVRREDVRPVATVEGASWSGEPRSREEAFQRLSVIAAYLKRVEPQHPVSYLLERAVRWTKMPLEEWLGEVIHNDDVLSHLRDTLGIKGGDHT